MHRPRWKAGLVAALTDHPIARLLELLPWHWKAAQTGNTAAA